MRHVVFHIAVFLLTVFFILPNLNAQDSLHYVGWRVSLFDIEILKTRGNTAIVKCRVANTGRLEAGLKKNAAHTVVELDTMNLPPLLWGHTTSLASVARENIPKLRPGEISSAIWLDVPAVMPREAQAGDCADLVFDTTYITNIGDDRLTMRYVIANIGNAAAEIAQHGHPLGVNVYFVSGTRLTRGAIPAGNTTIEKGRETLHGWLNPGQKTSGELVLMLKNRTKFASNLLVELAPSSSASECDRTNNTRTIELKY
jgi:hypothetical protein